MSSFVASIHEVRTETPKLILILNNEFYKTWLLDGDNKLKLRNMLSQYVYLPDKFDIDALVENVTEEDMCDKLARRYNDLTSR